MKSKNMSEEKYTAEDSYQNLEEWDDYGFDSKEEYEEYTQKCAEDSLYGYSDLLTMKELRALLKKEPYKPKDDDAKYPDHLLLDEKTGMYYTDFFAHRRTHMVLGNILAEECMMCENLDWERVTDNYSPYVIARIEYVCTHYLTWSGIDSVIANKMVIKGQLALPISDDKYDTDFFQDPSFDWDADRAVWLAKDVVAHWNTMKKVDPTLESELRADGLFERFMRHCARRRMRWNYLTHEYTMLGCSDAEHDPYFYQGEVTYWDKDTCLGNFETIYEKLGLDVVTQVLRAFQHDWRRITTFNEFDLDKISDKQKEEFRHFLFEEMDYYIDEWTEDEKTRNKSKQVKSKKKSTISKQDLEIEKIFSYRFINSGNFDRLRDFLDTVRDEVSDVEWANYALTMKEHPKIFIYAPKTFTGWLPRFCALFGREVTYRTPTKIKRTPCQKDISCYLHIDQ